MVSETTKEMVSQKTTWSQKSDWIPVRWHEITDKERREEGYPKERTVIIDSLLPADGERIFITTKDGLVEADECCSDDGMTFYLDSGRDWIDDVVAWKPWPKPYVENKQERRVRI